jgi:nitrogen fixation protein NifU and related proteins
MSITKHDRQESPNKEEITSSPSAPAVQSWLGPFNEGVIEGAEGRARVTGPCGDTMEIYLRIRNEHIIDSRFRVNGCAVSRACASAAAALANGKGLEEAWDIDEKEILRTLQMVPDSERHCALLARDTLRQALENYIKSPLRY